MEEKMTGRKEGGKDDREEGDRGKGGGMEGVMIHKHS